MHNPLRTVGAAYGSLLPNGQSLARDSVRDASSAVAAADAVTPRERSPWRPAPHHRPLPPSVSPTTPYCPGGEEGAVGGGVHLCFALTPPRWSPMATALDTTRSRAPTPAPTTAAAATVAATVAHAAAATATAVNVAAAAAVVALVGESVTATPPSIAVEVPSSAVAPARPPPLKRLRPRQVPALLPPIDNFTLSPSLWTLSSAERCSEWPVVGEKKGEATTGRREGAAASASGGTAAVSSADPAADPHDAVTDAATTPPQLAELSAPEEGEPSRKRSRRDVSDGVTGAEESG